MLSQKEMENQIKLDFFYDLTEVKLMTIHNFFVKVSSMLWLVIRSGFTCSKSVILSTTQKSLHMDPANAPQCFNLENRSN